MEVSLDLEIERREMNLKAEQEKIEELKQKKKETKNDPSEESETRPTELVSLVSLLQSSVSLSEERQSSLTETLLYVRGLAEKQAQERSARIKSLTELQQRMSGFRARLGIQKE